MPDAKLLEAFPTPAESPFVIEHVNEEFTSVCPVTGHPDFGAVAVVFQPKGAKTGGRCVELKSLKLYFQSFRNEGIYYEAVTNRIRDDLADTGVLHLDPCNLTAEEALLVAEAIGETVALARSSGDGLLQSCAERRAAGLAGALAWPEPG